MSTFGRYQFGRGAYSLSADFLGGGVITGTSVIGGSPITVDTTAGGVLIVARSAIRGTGAPIWLKLAAPCQSWGVVAVSPCTPVPANTPLAAPRRRAA